MFWMNLNRFELRQEQSDISLREVRAGASLKAIGGAPLRWSETQVPLSSFCNLRSLGPIRTYCLSLIGSLWRLARVIVFMNDLKCDCSRCDVFG